MLTNRTSTLALVAALLPAAALAQDALTLDPVVLSAGFAPLSGSSYGRAHTVLTGEEIEERGLATVEAALRAVPGVSVSRSGSTPTQVRIRGGEGNHTLILIDGIEAMAGADEYDLGGLETANIERIEVLRGPQSVYYGSNASSGVINIITRKGGPGPAQGGTLELGNGAAASAFVTRGGDWGGLALNLSARDDNGFDQSGDGGEKDGTERQTLSFSGWSQATENLRLGVTLRRSWEDYEYDAVNSFAPDADGYIVDDPDPAGKRVESQGALWAEFSALEGRMTHRLEYQSTYFRRSDNGEEWNRGETRQLKYLGRLGLDGRPVEDAAHLLNLLLERQEDESSTAPDYKREMTSAALEYRGFLDNGLDVQAGLRHDDNEVFEDATSWNLALSWQVPDRPFRLHASAGKGIVNPSYFELFADVDFGTLVYRGNPGLKPEHNRGFDLGVEAELPGGRGTVDVTWFRETLTDEIENYLVGFEDGVAVYGYRNQSGDSPREGVEVTGRFAAADNVDVALNYTYLDAKNPDGSVEVRRPRHELGLAVTTSFLGGRGQVTADLRHVSGNYDSRFFGDYATAELPAYTVVNLSAGYDLTERVRLTSRVVNLFDEEYSDVWGYASQDRTAYVGLQARW